MAQQELEATKKEANRLAAEIASNQMQLTRLQDDLDTRRQEIQGLERQREDLEQSLRDRQQRTLIIRTEPVVFSTGQEIARRVIYKPERADEVQKEIEKLLDAADARARSRGAQPLKADGETPGAEKGEQLSKRAILLFPVGAISSSGTQQQAEEEAMIQSVLAKRIAAEGGSVVLRVLTAANSVEGEPVQVNLEVSPNLLIYKRGDLIASRRVDGRLPEDKVLESLIDLLQTEVRSSAVTAGLLPPPSGSVGEINWGQLLDAVHEIRKRQRPVEVRVVALTDAFSADLLLVRFMLPA
jgi:uncharacterized protein (DUF3084 family)